MDALLKLSRDLSQAAVSQIAPDEAELFDVVWAVYEPCLEELADVPPSEWRMGEFRRAQTMAPALRGGADGPDLLTPRLIGVMAASVCHLRTLSDRSDAAIATIVDLYGERFEVDDQGMRDAMSYLLATDIENWSDVLQPGELALSADHGTRAEPLTAAPKPYVVIRHKPVGKVLKELLSADELERCRAEASDEAGVYGVRIDELQGEFWITDEEGVVRHLHAGPRPLVALTELVVGQGHAVHWSTLFDELQPIGDCGDEDSRRRAVTEQVSLARRELGDAKLPKKEYIPDIQGDTYAWHGPKTFWVLRQTIRRLSKRRPSKRDSISD